MPGGCQRSLLRGQTGHPLVYDLGILPEEFPGCLFALLGEISPHDANAMADEVSGMLADRPVAAVKEAVFSENVPQGVEGRAIEAESFRRPFAVSPRRRPLHQPGDLNMNMRVFCHPSERRLPILVYCASV